MPDHNADPWDPRAYICSTHSHFPRAKDPHFAGRHAPFEVARQNGPSGANFEACVMLHQALSMIDER
jgi:hypothetical protein